MNHHKEDQNRKIIYDQLRTNAINILKQPMFEIKKEVDYSLTEENTTMITHTFASLLR